jgi:hypothetical protein
MRLSTGPFSIKKNIITKNYDEIIHKYHHINFIRNVSKMKHSNYK